MRERSRWIVMMLGCGLIGGFAGDIARSFADNTPATSNILDQGVVLPYDGYLMLDSSPVNKDDQQVRFSLYESVSGGTAQWVETQTVNVVNGKFSVALGADVANKVSSSPANATFSDVILDAQRLFIGIEVLNDQGQFVELSGRQAIQAAPYAAWSARSADFKAEGDLTVQGVTRPQNGIVMRNDTSISGLDKIIGFNDLHFHGSGNNASDLTLSLDGNASFRRNVVVAEDVSAANVTARQQLTIEGHELLLGTNAARGDGGRALVEGGGDQLIINFAGDFSGGTEVNSSLSVTGNTMVSGNIRATGRYENLKNTLTRSHFAFEVSGAHNTGKSYANSICFLTGVYMDHLAGDPGYQQCLLQESNQGTWELILLESPNYNATDTNCEVMCIDL